MAKDFVSEALAPFSMPIYHLEYETDNFYEEEVQEGLYDLLVSPCSNDSQRLLKEEIQTNLGVESYEYRNLFGFRSLRFRREQPFRHCRFSFRFSVQRNEDVPLLQAPEVSWQALEELAFRVDHALYLQQTPFTDPSGLGNWIEARAFAGPWAFLAALTEQLHATIAFEANVTNVHTTARETLALGKGVCQDFAHLFLGLARQAGIPCRYVSGYLNPGAHYLGDAAMHAWVETFLPGLGWWGWDAANNLQVNRHFIKVSHGVDYQDCSPLKGILRTAGAQTTEYRVRVWEMTQHAQQQ